ncbi:hypothetical protein BJ508DRAFT_360217 [Ascobolus immersus RN42]|uniref:Uncharacterized protein n=1 Tax=Ascobolus immersus RN42 TaxID=1160509 RepID=A0A3N4IE84_ASCIM|nr:hypothetical protein BJ508DRAFT_360217 [Ascobolus immersus RN42]
MARTSFPWTTEFQQQHPQLTIHNISHNMNPVKHGSHEQKIEMRINLSSLREAFSACLDIKQGLDAIIADCNALLRVVFSCQLYSLSPARLYPTRMRPPSPERWHIFLDGVPRIIEAWREDLAEKPEGAPLEHSCRKSVSQAAFDEFVEALDGFIRVEGEFVAVVRAFRGEMDALRRVLNEAYPSRQGWRGFKRWVTGDDEWVTGMVEEFEVCQAWVDNSHRGTDILETQVASDMRLAVEGLGRAQTRIDGLERSLRHPHKHPGISKKNV